MKFYAFASILALASAGTAEAGDSCTSSSDCREENACCGTSSDSQANVCSSADPSLDSLGEPMQSCNTESSDSGNEQQGTIRLVVSTAAAISATYLLA
mmetsp:Transcript_22300/g.34507  ORF Transcript_22300/g.34507 Transcript_22300/m.34507 type:complete len:98 (+) Transcript_22300:44-337(+)